MTRRGSSPTGMARIALLILACAVGVTHAAVAQQARNARIRSAFEAYDRFETARALELLRAAVNPAEGPPDSLWARAVHLMAQILTEEGRHAPAAAWTRWALRRSPSMSLDSVTFLPEVVALFRGAKQAVGSGSPGDPVTETSWTWSAPGAREGQGVLRVQSPMMPVGVRALIQGAGVIGTGQTLALAPGTYEIQVAAEGYLATVVTREVLPSVTTVLSFNLARVPAVAPPVAVALSEGIRTAVGRQIVPLTVRRFGTEPACAMAGFVSGQGLVVTTYQAIRGAEAVQVELSGRGVSDEARMVAYDVRSDLAVLQVPAIRADSLSLSAGAPFAGENAWAFGLRDCRTPTDTRVAIAGTSGPGGTLELSDALTQPLQGGPLVSASGTMVGVVSGSGVAVPVRAVIAVVEEARRNAVLGQLATAAQVALRENHAYGSVAIAADVTGATARISPLEAWQWSGTARIGALPLTFVGPMGRYQLDVEAPGQPMQRQEFRVQAATAQRLAVAVRPVAGGPQPTPQVPPPPQRGGGFPLPLAIGGGAVAVGAVAFLLLSGGDGPGGTGGIAIRIPNTP